MSRSLRASEEGIKQIRKAMRGIYTQEKLVEALKTYGIKISRTTITNLLSGKAIDRSNFEELCKFLELDWRDIRGEEVANDENLDHLVQEVKQKIAADVTERCGTMRVLDMTQPVDLDRIYTNVNIIKDVRGWRNGSSINSPPRPGFDAVREFQKLVLLGKLGSGKTTFMQYLAKSCIDDKFYKELIPIFVSLSEYNYRVGFNEQLSLHNYILMEFQNLDVADNVVNRLLKSGKALILLDGLDQVKKENDRKIKNDIEEFARLWNKNRFVITCRVAARKYQLSGFTEVEVADFDDSQIETFVNNFFEEKNKEKANHLLERLRDDNEPVQALARNPLLLSLLCLMFTDNELPKNINGILKAALDLLLSKWDDIRNVDRDVSKPFIGEEFYKNLLPEEKVAMFASIAFSYLREDKYVFQEDDLINKIRDYISKLNVDSKLNIRAIIETITHHHGLFVKGNMDTYSFSHTIFQEYFVAKEIERKKSFTILLQNIANPKWKEVFCLTAEMLKESNDLDGFVKIIKEHIDGMLANDNNLQKFLEWADKKTNSIKSINRPVAVRAFYAYIEARARDSKSDRNRDINLNYARASANDLANKLNLNSELEIDLSLDRYLALDYPFKLDPDPNKISIEDIIFERILDLELENLDSSEFSDNKKLQLARERVREINDNLDNAIHLSDNIGNISLQQALQLLKSNLPSQKSLLLWWGNDRKSWRDDFFNVCIRHRNISHDWQFTDEQVELLSQYYAANLLLVECMNRSYVNKQVREEIESTMLLPSKK